MTMPFRLGAIALLMSVGAMGSAVAETTTDRYGKEFKIEPSRDLFARFGVLGFKLNNDSEAARDVSGPVLSRPANLTAPTLGDRGWYKRFPGSASETIYADPSSQTYDDSTEYVLFRGTGVDQLGLPADVRADFQSPAPGVVATLGMYLDEDHKWALEVPVAALPFGIDVYGDGAFKQAGKIIEAKVLGFLVFGHYYFGKKTDKFRPSVSLTANYLIPYDVQSTPELERWTGGRTKVTSKASLGLGWMVGGKYSFNDRWDIGVNLGQFKSKIESTLVTYDTKLYTDSPIFQYWPGQLGANLRQLGTSSVGGVPVYGGVGNILDDQLYGMMVYRNSDPSRRVNGGANLGNFTRKQTQTLDPYVFMLSVGYSF